MLVKLLAKALGVPRSSVAIAGGAHSRDKIVDIAGVDDEAVHALLP